jgi:hypothetical protein
LIAPAVLALLSLAGFLLYRGYTSVRIVPISQTQIDSIWGPDLRWSAATDQGPEVQITDLARLGRDPIVGQVADHLSTKPYTPEEVEQIRGSWRISSALSQLVAGKRLKPEKAANWRAVSLNFTPMKDLAKVQAAQIKLECEAKDAKRCYESCRMALDYANFLLRSHSSYLIEYLVRAAIHSIIFTAIDRALQTGIFDSAQLRGLFDRVAVGMAGDGDLHLALRAEWEEQIVKRIVSLNTAADVNSFYGEIMIPPGAPPRALDFAAGEFDRPATLRKLAQICRAMLANCGRTWSAQDDLAAKEEIRIDKLLPDDPYMSLGGESPWYQRSWEMAKFKAKMRAIPNSLGLWFTELEILPNVSEASFRKRTQREGLRLELLFQLYKKLHKGDLPSTLDALVDLAGRRQFPKDYFADAPFLYSKAQGKFWSVGKNGIDDGGSGTPNRPTGLDLVWTVR